MFIQNCQQQPGKISFRNVERILPGDPERLGILERIRLEKAKPFIGKNRQGEYRMWTFVDLEDNDTKVFFAPDDAHAVLQNLGVGSELILRKVPVQQGNKISPKFELTVVSAVATSNGHNGKVDNFKQILLQCILDASDVVKQSGLQFSMEETEKLAVALLIARTKTT